MAKVKVWNDNKYPHKESYKGDMVVIPAGGFVEMDWEEAIQFKGQFTGMAPLKATDDGLGGMGEPDPKFFKMIRVDPPADDPVKDDGLVNHATGKRASDTAELLAQVLQFARENPDRVVKDDDLEKRSGSADDRVAELERQLAELKALVMNKPKPGPKPGFKAKKEASA